jgi:localization factor PodJL
MAGEAAAVDARATQAGFIAAARRAARGRWTQDTQATLAEAASRSDGRFLTGLAAHRRSAVIALAAVMLLAGAFQLTQNVSVDGPRQMTAARDSTPPTPQEPVETAAKAKPTSSKQASTVDPAPVGAIVNPGRSGIVASMNSAMALATLAANGDAAAQFELASRYADGRDIARDSKLAVLWFDKAAKQGLAPAQYRLGTLYEKGLGVERNEAAAMDWYRRAADSGNIRAMHNLAVMLAEGGEGKPDYAAAAVWFRKAAELGLRDSQYNLAILYARGLGVETSLTQSYLWFSAAAAQGDADAGKKRDEVAARLGARDLETARALVAGFHAKTPVPAANDVVPPPGGWRAPAPTPSRAINKPKVSWFQSF